MFVEYLPEDGRKRPKHVAGLPHACILLSVSIVQLLVYMWRRYVMFSTGQALLNISIINVAFFFQRNFMFIFTPLKQLL